MSLAADPDGARAGRLACLCPPLGAAGGEGAATFAGTAALIAGAGFACLAQVLVYGTLPLAGALLSRDAVTAALPMAVCLGGAVLASLPGAFLFDAFGRRAALATGASLGAAGGMTVAAGLIALSLPVVLVGAFWLGVAQGFAMLYRHAAAAGAGGVDRRRQVAAVLGVGVLAGLAGPALATFAEGLAEPFTLVGAVLAAALASVAALLAAIGMPAAGPMTPAMPANEGTAPAPALTGSVEKAASSPVAERRRFLAATAIGAAAWAAMAATMTHAPMALVDCGVTAAAAYGLVAWHVVAMYAPAAAIGLFGLAVAPRIAAGAGLAVVAAALGATALPDPIVGQATALVMVGAGWSLATYGATLVLHEGAAPTRARLALHDGTLLSAALIGALFGGLA